MMLNTRSLLLGVVVLLGMGLVVAIIVLLAWRRDRSPSVSPNSLGQRLAVLVNQRPDYRILVGVPPAEPVSWAVVSQMAGDHLTVEGHGDILLAEVKAFVVAYPNGQIIDCEFAGLLPPHRMTGLQPGRNKHGDILRADDLVEGRKYIQVTYGRSVLRPQDRNHYSTKLTNISEKRVRVLRFAGYIRMPQGWRLNTVTGTFYSALEFREWYGLAQDEWVEPSQSVTDPNNYGSPPVLWAYYCQAEDGKEFIAGGVLE